MNNFYNFWMTNRNYWFNQNDIFDNDISSKYGYLIDDHNSNQNNPIIEILIYDQLTRHYYRKEDSKHIITYFNRKALKIALDNKNDNFINNLNYDDWCFYILVFRHTNEKEHLLFAMDQALKRGNKTFIKATFNRANFNEDLEVYNYYDDYYNYISFDSSILDIWNDDYDYYDDHPKTFEIIGDYSQLSLNTNNKIIVSLSGGVDSISCLYSCVQLFGNLRVIAIHINYNNRKETADEVNFLIWICNKLKVKLYVRTIYEIKRQYSIDNDMREVYETYTKRVRFNSYRKVHELENNSSKLPIIILGHNKDD